MGIRRALLAGFVLLAMPALAAGRQNLAAFSTAGAVTIDGAILTAEFKGGTFSRAISSRDGASRMLFKLTDEQFGTVWDASTGAFIGLFLVTPRRLGVQYANGGSEVLRLDRSGTIAMMTQTPNGAIACVNWYAADHKFSAAERIQALHTYQKQLGLAVAVSANDAAGQCATDDNKPLLGQSAQEQLGNVQPSAVFEDFYYHFLAPHEGGYVESDGNGSPANFGINQGANPDVDVARLTQEDAMRILYQRYWLPAGAERLSPALAAVHGDTAINLGVKAANQLLAQADGDPDKYLALRDLRYRAIAAPDSDRAKYLPLWLARNDDLRYFIGMSAASGNPADDDATGSAALPDTP